MVCYLQRTSGPCGCVLPYVYVPTNRKEERNEKNNPPRHYLITFRYASINQLHPISQNLVRELSPAAGVAGKCPLYSGQSHVPPVSQGSLLGKEEINIGGKLTVSATESKKIVEDFFIEIKL